MKNKLTPLINLVSLKTGFKLDCKFLFVGNAKKNI